MYCNYCGSELPDNAKFCPDCGTAILITESVEKTHSIKTIQNQFTLTTDQTKIIYDRSNSYYFWKAQKYKLIATGYLTTLSLFVSFFPLAFLDSDPKLLFFSGGLSEIANIFLLLAYVLSGMYYIYFISVTRSLELKWQVVIAESLKLFVYWIFVISLGLYFISISNLFLISCLFIATLITFGLWFDVPFGKGFYHHYAITPKYMFSKSWFIASFIILAILDLILFGVTFQTITSQAASTSQLQPAVNPTATVTKKPVKQPPIVPTAVIPSFVPSMHGMYCKHFTQITNDDIYKNICVYGRADGDYFPSFSWIVLQKGYRSIQLTSNVWTYDEYVPAGTCVVAYGRPQNNDNYITFIIHSETDQSNIYDEPNAGELCDK